MKQLLTLLNQNRRIFIFLKDKYGHNRVNIGMRGNSFLLGRSELFLLMQDERFNSNAFITENRIIFNGLKIEDLSAEEQAMYHEDVK